MITKNDYVTFNNGIKCPILGIGSWSCRFESEKIKQTIRDAIDAGYRHIDTALLYQSESAVGAAVSEKIDEGVIRREDIFITSKLWNTYQRSDLVKNCLQKSLSNLGMTYLDLYLIHWPLAFKEGDVLLPKDANGKLIFSNASFIHTWKEMEKLVESRMVRSIGLSNFNSKQVDEILSIAKIKPVVNQVECHPYLNQKQLKEFCEARGILIAAHTPLGAPDRLVVSEDDPVLLEDPKIREISERYHKSPAQILIKYQVQRSNIVIPKSFNKSHINENIDIFDFLLEEPDMHILETIDIKHRYSKALDRQSHKNYPFRIEF